MGSNTSEAAVRAARWSGHQLSDAQLGQLGRFHDWIIDEAIKAGGIGPNEANRLWSRHIGDSLLFGIALHRARSCLDLGSGVGLPGIPLAIMCPDIHFDLVDRSRRRYDLMKRAILVVGLSNCSAIHQDIAAVSNNADALVSRAAIPPERMMIHVKRLLAANGTAVLGLSTKRAVTSAPEMPMGWSSSIIDVPTDILDSPVTLLRIGST